MASNANTNDNPDLKTGGLLSKIFHKDKPAKKEPQQPQYTGSDSASVMSAATTLVPEDQNNTNSQTQRFASTSEQEHAQVGDLMTKAQTMSPEEFKAYLRRHKEKTEAEYRKQGGGIAGGEWMSQDTTGEYDQDQRDTADY